MNKFWVELPGQELRVLRQFSRLSLCTHLSSPFPSESPSATIWSMHILVQTVQMFRVSTQPLDKRKVIQYRWTIQSASHFKPWETCSFQHQLGFTGKHSALLQFCVKTLHLHIFTTLRLGSHLCIWMNWGANLRNGSKEDSNPGPLVWESGVLRLSYHTPHIAGTSIFTTTSITHRHHWINNNNNNKENSPTP